METARCMKCKTTKTFMTKPSYETLQTKKGPKGLLRGNCNECNTNMCKIIKAYKEE